MVFFSLTEKIHWEKDFDYQFRFDLSIINSYIDTLELFQSSRERKSSSLPELPLRERLLTAYMGDFTVWKAYLTGFYQAMLSWLCSLKTQKLS